MVGANQCGVLSEWASEPQTERSFILVGFGECVSSLQETGIHALDTVK
ncbi:hypothetical protein J2S07_001331 [Robertmurraya andreesenii]|uniref:Uncharacterized protein n=1 Tax=Anoxybacillus andreesenii TaxID=1325932 RepID=A0ABT9V2A6_9BACL|nr:hypothetical protein [Robertmurraya andreesenii]